jgi:hypothetical protein
MVNANNKSRFSFFAPPEGQEDGGEQTTATANAGSSAAHRKVRDASVGMTGWLIGLRRGRSHARSKRRLPADLE